MVGPEGLELIVNPLNYLSNTQHAQIVTVKATVKSAGFGWTGLDCYRSYSGYTDLILKETHKANISRPIEVI